jgi:tRNA (guanine37-N1)-methyltransferase
MITFDIITTFPAMFESPLNESILKRAREKGLLHSTIHNLRNYTVDKHQVTDDYPYGGGAGMVMKIEPLVAAIESLRTHASRLILLSPQGKRFDQKEAKRLAHLERIILVCGHYEGIDERIKYFIDEEISIGDYILTGGEVAALVIIDAVTRLIPGVLGEPSSAHDETFTDFLLEYPQYTRPRNFRGLEVPEVLLSGNHQEISTWRRQESLRKTLTRRPDLLEHTPLSPEDRKILEQLMKNSIETGGNSWIS